MNPLRSLALSYAPQEAREGLGALFALDAALGDVLRTTREPMVGRIRLAWWREALERLDTAPPPAQPVLEALAAHVVGRHGVTGARLSRLVDAWEVLLDPELDVEAVEEYAASRAGIFGVAADLCGRPGDDRVEVAGRGWALADLAANLSDPVLAEKVRTMARSLLTARAAWPRPLRALGALALIAGAELDEKTGGALVARLAWHRVSGR